MTRAPMIALQAFVEIAKAGNLTRAAEAMHLTVSALSHQMRTLEDRLDRKLLLRGPRGVRLTEEGQCLYDAIAGPFGQVELALTNLRRRNNAAITVSLMPSVASSWLLPRLPGFVAAYPEIELSLQSSTVLVDFARDPVDCALRFGLGKWPGVRADFLFEEWLTPVASPQLIAKIGKPRLEDLGSYPLLGDPGERWASWFERFGGKAPRRFVANFSDSETAQRAAVEGIGIALGRITMATPLIETGRLLQLTRKRLRAEYAHWFVQPARSEQHAGVQTFRAWLLSQAKPQE
jgi:LysR family transcriptional regulator, glycine cleavage system transcriptional activator